MSYWMREKELADKTMTESISNGKKIEKKKKKKKGSL